jgi:hypothetical protein
VTERQSPSERAGGRPGGRGAGDREVGRERARGGEGGEALIGLLVFFNGPPTPS